MTRRAPLNTADAEAAIDWLGTYCIQADDPDDPNDGANITALTEAGWTVEDIARVDPIAGQMARARAWLIAKLEAREARAYEDRVVATATRKYLAAHPDADPAAVRRAVRARAREVIARSYAR